MSRRDHHANTSAFSEGESEATMHNTFGDFNGLFDVLFSKLILF